MRVDSFAYLPRSFQAMYADPPRHDGEDHPVWAPFAKRLADARVALLTSLNAADTISDHEVSLPLRTLLAAAEGMVGSVADTHYSVMGYQQAGLDEWRARTGPEIAARLRRDDVDALVLAPT